METMTDCLPVQKPVTRVGLHAPEDPPDISLEGTGIEAQHAVFLLERDKVSA